MATPQLDKYNLSNDGSEVIAQRLQIDSYAQKDRNELQSYYSLDRIVQFITSHGYKRIALQFPDSLLPDSASLALEIQTISPQSIDVFILADTSYGSCCVDEIAASHGNADCLIHFGSACLSPLPVLYVFGRHPVDANKCKENAVYETLHAQYPNLIASEIKVGKLSAIVESSAKLLEDKENQSCDQEEYGRIFHLHEGKEIHDYVIFYIGSEGLTLTNLMMSYNKCRFYSYNPDLDSSRSESLSVNKALMKRYYLIQKAKEALVVGIVIGTLGVADYLQTLDRLKAVLKAANKKTYTFSVGKINVAKLANFMEIDVFVLVACPENTLLDSKEFYKPILTPYELEIACLKEREWDGTYITDFRQLLPGNVGLSEGGLSNLEFNVDDERKNRNPDYSFITGHMQYTSLRDDDENINHDKQQSLVTRDRMQVIQHHTSAGEFLSNRSWKGLDDTPDDDSSPINVVEGRRGIAAKYDNENIY
ncbi:uncharacterized protein TRIADDRAFT_51287 [Trichoplax adhaerens]|uniref:2-(3-amino-3-carboxypropyl)histidine synthase subunit 2 n=1 Tax=Trichoplax adhaerens TaxID=10228 RepID=B3RIE1_TRIAD|nr:hypothetical protein TRIADDRAFT_51287 [Trichoplax adhaerens]EDV29221.1 hypothetical protein TRIADDRAFT_51287 [Trichoplax adhaerens]|eukprot:XP_002108423.1 hypothetical protein TRIADDRAFT_51287 [Trichoplax adhaerens]